MNTKEFKKEIKEMIKKENILNSICKECGRKDAFKRYCIQCWNTMKKEIV